MIDFNEFISRNSRDIYKTLEELAIIPAPSGHEEERADYCLNFLRAVGGTDAYIDDALNVILPINISGKDNITVIGAHTDIVFDSDVPLDYREREGRIFCPGIGDDTASVVVLLYTAKYLLENGIKPENGLLIVFDSCEEGMGNLRGIRRLMKDYEGRIKEFITYDACFDHIIDVCVGSHRYKVTVKTEGGHSFTAFGNSNAIAELSEIITELYKLEVPEIPGTYTTYNVGTIEGGTSINTIAQDAAMLCEYRSDSRECLDVMKSAFNRIFEAARSDKAEVIVELIGERPCAEVDAALQSNLANRCVKVCEEVYEIPVTLHSGSTDCNIPLSLGIPAVAVGVYVGGKSHTREEWIEKESLTTGLLCSLRLIYELCSL